MGAARLLIEQVSTSGPVGTSGVTHTGVCTTFQSNGSVGGKSAHTQDQEMNGSYRVE